MAFKKQTARHLTVALALAMGSGPASAEATMAVPEPGVISLLGIGAIIGLIALIRRRK